ncbi:EAL domain-containing protein [Marinobacter sediminicola]|uniref:EAL domain-containing protein n=1 Tax=Marinobacter sediminicola TaxID=3072994 RepID=UPI002810A7A5|nr:EAL domain-containing protein [Marinobacter sp. F26243]
MPNVGHSFRWTQVLIVMASGLSAFCVYVLITLVVAVQGTLASQSVELDALISEAEKIALESRSVINRLNAQGIDQCNETMLAVMRRELFLANRVRDIGFVRDNAVLCTTGQGILESPYQQGPWDFTSEDGFRYWPAVRLILFNGDMTAPIVGKGRFNVVFDTRWLEQLVTVNGRWELTFRNRLAQIQHAFGDSGVYRSLGDKSAHATTLTSIYSQTCSNTIPYCASTEIEHMDVLRRNPSLAAFLVMTGLILGSGSGLVSWLVLKRRLSTSRRIIRGLKHKAYFPLYQPIVDLEHGSIIGCEVLARFRDAYGAIDPEEFIPVLASVGESWRFTQLVMQKTLDDLNARTGLPAGFKVNINLFPSDIAQSRMKDADISLALATSRFNITFEITEDENLDTATAKDCIHWIKQNGFELAVDDFGTGYSNLAKVRDLGCNTLKIDRSFVFDIDTGGLGAALVPLMVRIAHELGMDVVAEGVETNAQAKIVAGMGIRFGQGWAFGRPMSARTLEERVRQTL